MADLLGLVEFGPSPVLQKDRASRALACWPASAARREVVYEHIFLAGISLNSEDRFTLTDECNRKCTCGWTRMISPDAIKNALAHRNILRDMPPPFAGCLFNHNDQTFYLITDPYGLQPVYYGHTATILYFSTKLFPLFACSHASTTLDPRGVADLLTYEHTTGDRTLFADIQVVPPGTVLEYRGGTRRMERYYVLECGDSREKTSLRDAAHELAAGLHTAVAKATSGHSRIAITLSGGLDSRALLGSAMAVGRQPVTYTFGSEKCRDRRYAAALSRQVGVRHVAVESDGTHLNRRFDQALFQTGANVSCIHYHILTLADALAETADVVLDGLGGDALTGAHIKWWMTGEKDAEKVIRTLFSLRATAFRELKEHADLFAPELRDNPDYEASQAIREHFIRRGARPLWSGAHRFDLLERQRRFIQYGPHLLRASVPVKTPFYGSEFVRTALQMPLSYLRGQRAYLEAHRCVWRNLAAVPDSTRGVPLTAPLIVRRAKLLADAALGRVGRRLGLRGWSGGPADYDRWIVGAYGRRLKEEIEAGLPFIESVFQPKYLKGMLHDQRSMMRYSASQLSALATVCAAARTASGVS